LELDDFLERAGELGYQRPQEDVATERNVVRAQEAGISGGRLA